MLKAKFSAISWWRSGRASNSASRGYAICDACSHRHIRRGGGYMSGSWLVCPRCWWFKWHYGGKFTLVFGIVLLIIFTFLVIKLPDLLSNYGITPIQEEIPVEKKNMEKLILTSLF